MEQDTSLRVRGIQWVEIIAIILSLCGVIIFIGGAISVANSQTSSFNAPIWPLPGLVLTYWAILGIVHLVFTILIAMDKPNIFLYGSWSITGAFIPLMILGALSIGSIVLMGFVLFLFSSILLSLRRKVKWLTSLGLFILGAVISAGVLLAMIALWNPQFFAN